MMIKNLLTSAAMTLIALSSVTAGEFRTTPVAVLELFTSQGCSSCPPADAVLSELSERDDIIALAYHVDYWDYIGWVDTFGRPENADYQRGYAAAQGSKRIYTPQLMVNGVEDVVGSRRSDVDAAVGAASLTVPVNLSYENDMLDVTVPANVNLEESKIWLVTYRQNAHVDIERGENTNRSIDYSHIVTERRVLGMWEPDAGAHLKLPLSEILIDEADGAAIIVQTDVNGAPGRVLGASSYSL